MKRNPLMQVISVAKGFHYLSERELAGTNHRVEIPPVSCVLNLHSRTYTHLDELVEVCYYNN